MKNKQSYILLISILLLSTTLNALTTTFTENVSNRWDNAGNWSNGIPGPGDDAIIALGFFDRCEIRNGFSYSVRSLQVSGFLSSLRVSGELNVSGETVIGVWSSIESRGEIVLNGNTTLSAVSNLTAGNRGNIVVNGDIDFANSSGTIRNTRANSSFTINGDILNLTNANFTFTVGEVTYSGNNTQTLAPTNYRSLTLDGTGQKNIWYGDVVATNEFNANSTDISVVRGDLEITASSGNTDFGTSTVTYEANGNQTIPEFPSALYNLSIDGGGTKILETSITDLKIENDISILDATFDVEDANVLFQGNFINNGRFSQRNNTVTISGTELSTISGSSLTEFYNLTLAKDLNTATLLESEISILPNGVLSLSSSNDALKITSGDLNLKADATGYGAISEIPNGSGVSGEVNVEAYFNASQRSWWQVTSPVSAKASDWLDDILITGDFIGNTNDGVIGDDLQSMYAFDETSILTQNDSWVNFPSLNISEDMTLGKGYRVFIRDDALTVSPKTVDLKGELHQGDLTIPLTYTSTGNATNDGWNLVGNPYPAALNWGDVDKTGLEFTSAYVWNANLKTYDKFGPNISIAPYQAFFIKALPSENDLLFTESMKTSRTRLQRTGISQNVINIQLKEEDSNDAINSASTKIIIDNLSTPRIDREYDMGLLSRNAFNRAQDETLVEIGTVSENVNLKINKIPETYLTSIIPIHVEYSSKKDFNIKINKENFSKNTELQLYDNYLGETIPMEGNEIDYIFNTPDKESRKSDRFSLTIDAQPLGVTSENEETNFLRLFPNPTSDNVNYEVNWSHSNFKISVTDMLGNEVLNKTILNSKNSISGTLKLDRLNKGIYHVSINSGNNQETRRLIVK